MVDLLLISDLLPLAAKIYFTDKIEVNYNFYNILGEKRFKLVITNYLHINTLSFIL